MKRPAIAAAMTLMLALAGASFAQTPETASAPASEKTSKSEVSLNIEGLYTKNASDAFIATTTTRSMGVKASYAYYLSSFGGVEVDYGRSRFSNNFTSVSTGTIGEIQSNVNEVGLAYINRFEKGHKFSPFVTVGGAWIIFSPTSSATSVLSDVQQQMRSAFTYGGGLDYNLNKHFSLRAAYRGMIYRSPDLNSTYLVYTAKTHTAEPSVGVVYRF
jgi:opacity protein-like surface antigen